MRATQVIDEDQHAGLTRSYCRQKGRRARPHVHGAGLFAYSANRYYDPATEQFISVDPLVNQTGQPFSFANDNPINGSDPTGRIGGVGRFMNHVPMAGTWAAGWDTMTGAEQVGVATLPITLPLLGLACVTTLGGCASALGVSGTVANEDPQLIDGASNACPALASTGQAEASNLTEQIAMEAAKSDPMAGKVLDTISLGDSRWPSNQGWVKMQQVISGVTIHYNLNVQNGETADWKFK